MESCVTEVSAPAAVESENLKEADSAVNFQKFVYDLFEKNGILNDLRAYLRGHIVDVLKSAQTGEPPTCQKHFTQRLDLTYQALNIVIAEYLLRLDFGYSLSVFVSEIPLANMVFSFAKNLMLTNKGDFEDLRFKDNDIWSILNYLGIKCDSEHASRVVEMYNGKDNLPLLFCILQCMPMYNKEACFEDHANSSSESASSSGASAGPAESSRERCRRKACKPCKARLARLKDKYRNKKRQMLKNVKSSEINPSNGETLVKNINVMEKRLVDEMFQQLKGVYETEVEMMKLDEEKKIKRSLASHALQLQRRQDEMEESFKAREAELERNVQEKKKFLWGLARALRDQHAAMQRAMHAVRHETDRLSAKEDSLKSQLLEAEDVLRKRGEDMRLQISNELVILEGHLESMKKERESINRERAELEDLKVACNSSCVIKVHDLNNEELKSHYDLLSRELSILRKYVQSTRLAPRCVIERGTLTDLSAHPLNNQQDVDRIPLQTDSEERKTPNKVINDLKKEKNVNFSASNMEDLYLEPSRSRSSASEPERAAQLADENERLKAFARQQRLHIESLSAARARLAAELAARPRTAPPASLCPMNARAGCEGWRAGAGEQLSAYSSAQPRVLLPGDALPFIGVLRDRHVDARRHMISQWRAMRRRASPPERVPRVPAPADSAADLTETVNPTVTVIPPLDAEELRERRQSPSPRRHEMFTFTAVTREKHESVERPKSAVTHQSREKTPKSALLEHREKLKSAAPLARAASPGAVVREAKLRLRKLQLEADAVEAAYRAFRQRRDNNRGKADVLGVPTHNRLEENYIAENVQVQNLPRFDVPQDSDSRKRDFDKYLYQYNTLASYAKHRSPVRTKPEETTEKKENYLETPLTEFRKLYTQKHPSVGPVDPPRAESEDKLSMPDCPSPAINRGPPDPSVALNVTKEEELEILKDNVSHLYDVRDHSALEQKIESMVRAAAPPAPAPALHVQPASRCSSLKVGDSDTQPGLVLVVESSVESHDAPRATMTILASPKRSSSGVREVETLVSCDRGASPDHARLTRNDVLDAIFHADASKNQSSVEMELEVSKELMFDSVSECERGEDYADDFTADVDNYNSDVGGDDDEPISLPKTSEDDNLWDN